MNFHLTHRTVPHILSNMLHVDDIKKKKLWIEYMLWCGDIIRDGIWCLYVDTWWGVHHEYHSHPEILLTCERFDIFIWQGSHGNHWAFHHSIKLVYYILLTVSLIKKALNNVWRVKKCRWMGSLVESQLVDVFLEGKTFSSALQTYIYIV